MTTTCEVSDAARQVHWCPPGNDYRWCHCGYLERCPGDDDGPWTFHREIKGPHVAEGFDFRGCSQRQADGCACETWTECTCETCGQAIRDGQSYMLVLSWPERVYDGDDPDGVFHQADCWNERGA